MDLDTSSAKWRPLCLWRDELARSVASHLGLLTYSGGSEAANTIRNKLFSLLYTSDPHHDLDLVKRQKY